MGYLLEDFACCPKCTTAVSKGLIVEENCFIEHGESAGAWLHFARCVNCGFRHELGQRPSVVLK